jgi:hypothetical protein
VQVIWCCCAGHMMLLLCRSYDVVVQAIWYCCSGQHDVVVHLNMIMLLRSSSAWWYIVAQVKWYCCAGQMMLLCRSAWRCCAGSICDVFIFVSTIWISTFRRSVNRRSIK